ncbi:MAG: PepSY domain-containing protein [Pseudomonadota bacterium]
MKTLSKTIAVISITACIAGTSFYVYAESENNDALAVKNAIVNLSQALSTALKTVPGVASKAEFSNDDNNFVWEIEIIGQDQQVHDIEINANSGTVVKNSIDNNDQYEEDDA